jgi:hypothetical protein
MPIMRLMKASTLTVTQYAANAVDIDGDFVVGSSSTIDIECSIQPITKVEQMVLPEGYTSNDAELIYTDTKLRTSSQFTKEPADTTVIDSLVYECFTVEDWTKNTLIPFHFKCLFIRRDQDI